MNRFFSLDWARIPFQPILYTFLALGAAVVLLVDANYPSFQQTSLFVRWIAMSLVCPPLALLSWMLIRYRPGKPRYVGFWLRGAADVGQLVSFSAFLTVITQGIDPVASELYAVEALAAIWWFILILVIRDAWKLLVTERLASAIHEHEQVAHGSND